MNINVLSSIAEADCFSQYECTECKENDLIFQEMEKDNLYWADGKPVIAIDTSFLGNGSFYQLSVSDLFSNVALDAINEVSAEELAKADGFQKYNLPKYLDPYFYEDPRALSWDGDV